MVEIRRFSGLLRVSDTRIRAVAETVLPDGYDLSVVLCGDARTRKLNKALRGKDKPANVLSFPLSDRAGEIFLNPAAALREAHKFDLSPEGHLQYLLIHGCLHLAGFDHGSTMDRAEQKFLKRCNIR